MTDAPKGWQCVNKPEFSAGHHNKIQQPLNDAQMLAALLRSINGAHNWDSSYAPARNGKCVNAARDESTVVVNKESEGYTPDVAEA